ncbi:hypothetical protein ASPCAL03470 [Aspergillus calidoustus]|uniref:Uncharacterized protein n=1 Tax=Aspergillus calidoustus TaxID=454130 RepID=A0A0U5FSA6_ASPCI|nr:hypothetical protein ASPCAL03470 [Aspergillus calidoustus]
MSRRRGQARGIQKQRQEQRLKDKIDKAKLEEHVNNLVADESRKRPEHHTIETILKEIRDIQETLEGLHGRLVELSTKIASQAKENNIGQAVQQKKGKKVTARRW